MGETEKIVDGFRFLPPGLTAWVRKFIPDEEFKGFIPWTPMAKPLSQTILALVTSAGISLKKDPPFDMEREKREPIWGDRSYRAIQSGATEKILRSITYTLTLTTSSRISMSSFLWPGWLSSKKKVSSAVSPQPLIPFMVFNGRIMTF